MFQKLMADPERRTTYHQYLRELAEWTAGDDFQKNWADTVALIAPYVKEDPTAFTSYGDFAETEVFLKNYILRRSSFVIDQIEGRLSSDSRGR